MTQSERTRAYNRVKEWMAAGYVRRVAIFRTAAEFGMTPADFGRWLARRDTDRGIRVEDNQLTLPL